MEDLLLAASLRSRHDYELVSGYINIKKAVTYSKPFQILMVKVGEYYKRDPDAQMVVPEILMHQIAETIRNDKHLAQFSALIEDAVSANTSDLNVRHVILSAKQQEIGDQLAQALTTGSDKTSELFERYGEIKKMTDLDELDGEELEVYHEVDLEALVAVESDPDSYIQLYPLAINERLGGGVKGGHHLTVFARPETGKTAACVTASCGFLRQDKRVLYVINEDRPQDLILRHISCITGLNRNQIYAHPTKAKQLAESGGFENLIVMSAAPGTPQQIEDYIEKYEPQVTIVDQLRNLKVRSDNRVNQLEMAATAVRTIGKKTNNVMVSVTQAGDSADGKVFLEMGDVDYSNTGIPAQADVMVGIGVDATLEAENRRGISLCKNKLGGDHAQLIVNINPVLSRLTSVGER